VALVHLEGFALPVSVSAGFEDRGRALGALAEEALAWLAQRLGWRPAARLTVADEHDWGAVAEVPAYGVPQTWGDHTIVAADDGPLSRELAAAFLEGSPPGVREALHREFGDPVSLLRFFDHNLIHELVHLFCEQTSMRPAPLWVVELLCNLGMVGYLVERDPDGLRSLRVGTAASAYLPDRYVVCRALDEMERSFDASSLNFGWYIMRLTALADDLWVAAGPALYPAWYELLRGDGPPVTVDDVVALHPAVGPALARWPL